VTNIHTIHAELTLWHKHRQPYTFEGNMATWDTHHTTQVPPLITQLDNGDQADTGAAYRATPASRPPVSLDALDTLIHIDHEAAEWVRKLGHDDPGDTIACIRKVYSLAASANHCGYDKATIEDRQAVCCDVHRIERAMRRWWTQARIVSGWDQPAWAPNNTCPICSERRSLRIRVDDRSALCTNCRETWDSTNIGILAEHVRGENGEEMAAS
jgi:hypothetical protein